MDQRFKFSLGEFVLCSGERDKIIRRYKVVKEENAFVKKFLCFGRYEKVEKTINYYVVDAWQGHLTRKENELSRIIEEPEDK